MKIYAIICTRDKNLNPITKSLVDKLSSIPAKVLLMVNQKSIFSGYKKAFDSIGPKDNDIFILCHDDIEINETPESILKNISLVNASGYGFAGVAGTTLLGKNAVWWDHDNWGKGLHSGEVYHLNDGKPRSFHKTDYGPNKKVVVLDGLFLSASAKTLKAIGLGKPEYLIGDWDFYDLHYTFTSFSKGFSNITVPIKIAHHSSGELVGRDGWNENRIAFINKHNLPARI